MHRTLRTRPGSQVVARALLLGLLLAGLSGCVRFGAKPPQRLLAIAPEARLEAGKSVSGPTDKALFIETPSVAKAIDTQRVAVRTEATGYAYVQKALWVDTPANQFQALLSETISAKTDRIVLDPGQFPSQAGHVLHGELLQFGIDATTRQAVVVFDATLLTADGTAVRRQRFAATRPVSKIDKDNVAPPISAAANEVAAAVAQWVEAE